MTYLGDEDCHLHSESPDAGHPDHDDDAEDQADPQDPLVVHAELPENFV